VGQKGSANAKDAACAGVAKTSSATAGNDVDSPVVDNPLHLTTKQKAVSAPDTKGSKCLHSEFCEMPGMQPDKPPLTQPANNTSLHPQQRLGCWSKLFEVQDHVVHDVSSTSAMLTGNMAGIVMILWWGGNVETSRCSSFPVTSTDGNGVGNRALPTL